VKPKATCHITRQASINARVSVRYPIQTVKQASPSLLARHNGRYILKKIWRQMYFNGILYDTTITSKQTFFVLTLMYIWSF